MTHPNRYFDIPYFPGEAPVVNVPELLEADGASVELEIGFGRGHFLLARARAVPDALILGLETKRKGVFTAVERAAKHGLKNARPYHGDVFRALPTMGPDGFASRIFIHFPDPWWKVRHEKRMVVCPDLIAEAARLLKDNGELFVQTDVDYRAEQYLTVLKGCDLLAPAQGDGTVESNSFEARSLREKKCIETGLPIFRMLFRRVPRTAAPPEEPS